MWFWFIVGLVFFIGGLLLYAADDFIKYKTWSFSTEILGMGLMSAGGALAFVSFFAAALPWQDLRCN